MQSSALLLTAHPRSDSLTSALADHFCKHAENVQFEYADLYKENFDPRLPVEDEPDWDNSRKVYSDVVQQEMARVERNMATVMVFPIWWWSMPAMMKGWVDRVMNNGWAYGDRTYPHEHFWMIGLAGNDQASFQKRGYDVAVDTQLRVGIMDYCGVAHPRLEILYGSMEGDDVLTGIFDQVGTLGQEFANLITK